MACCKKTRGTIPNLPGEIKLIDMGCGRHIQSSFCMTDGLILEPFPPWRERCARWKHQPAYKQFKGCAACPEKKSSMTCRLSSALLGCSLRLVRHFIDFDWKAHLLEALSPRRNCNVELFCQLWLMHRTISVHAVLPSAPSVWYKPLYPQGHESGRLPRLECAAEWIW